MENVKAVMNPHLHGINASGVECNIFQLDIEKISICYILIKIMIECFFKEGCWVRFQDHSRLWLLV